MNKMSERLQEAEKLFPLADPGNFCTEDESDIYDPPHMFDGPEDGPEIEEPEDEEFEDDDSEDDDVDEEDDLEDDDSEEMEDREEEEEFLEEVRAPGTPDQLASAFADIFKQKE